MQKLIAKLTTQDLKEQMFLMAQKKLSAAEHKVYGAIFGALEARLDDESFDHFLDQVDEQIMKAAA